METQTQITKEDLFEPGTLEYLESIAEKLKTICYTAKKAQKAVEDLQELQDLSNGQSG